MPEENPNYGPQSDFKYVMERVLNLTFPKQQYTQGLNKLEEMVSKVSIKLKEMGLNVQSIRDNSEILKAEYDGDILMALNSLSGFVGLSDPRFSSGKKEDYLTEVLCWASIAKDYLTRNQDSVGTEAEEILNQA